MSELLREIGSTLAKIRALLADAKKDLQKLETLQQSLKGVLAGLWSSEDIARITASPQLCKELLGLVASGKALSVAAQANAELNKTARIAEQSWVGHGPEYARWLGRGIVVLLNNEPTSESFEKKSVPAVELCSRLFAVGYTGSQNTHYLCHNIL